MNKLLKSKKISLTFALLFGFSMTAHATIKADKIVTAYLLIDKVSELTQYLNDLKKVDKANFNRVVFSFVKPSLTEYSSGDLANTGILGYFDQSNEDGKSRDAFNLLQEAVRLSKQKNIQAFLS